MPAGEQTFLGAMDEALTLRRRMGQLDERVSALEARLAGTDFINPAQMKAYTDMVGLVAYLLNQKKKGGKARVHEVQRFLRDWYRRLAGPGTAIPLSPLSRRSASFGFRCRCQRKQLFLRFRRALPIHLEPPEFSSRTTFTSPRLAAVLFGRIQAQPHSSGLVLLVFNRRNSAKARFRRSDPASCLPICAGKRRCPPAQVPGILRRIHPGRAYKMSFGP